MTSAACREVWEFLSAWSELYGITADAGFLRAMSQKIQGANHSVCRCAIMVKHLPCVEHSSCELSAMPGTAQQDHRQIARRLHRFWKQKTQLR